MRSLRRPALTVFSLWALLGLRATVSHAATPLLVGLKIETVLTGVQQRRSFWSLVTGRIQSGELVRPFGLAWSGDDLLIADPGSRRVTRLDSRGRWSTSPEDSFSGPIGVASCPEGILVSDSRTGTLWRLDRKLRPDRLIAQGLARPTTVLCDENRIYVVETAAHRVLVLDSNGSQVDSYGRRGSGPGEFNFPAAAALRGDDLWVGDTLNFRLQRLRAEDGAPLGEFGHLGDAANDTPRIKGLGIDGTGRIWVTDAHLDNLKVFTENGAFLIEVGWRGDNIGEFSFPAGIAHHPDGRTAIADSLNRRVQVVRLTGMPNEDRP